MAYVQGFVIPVPAANREAYRVLAARVAPIFLEHGAQRIVECWGDEVPDGEVTDFRRAVQAEAGENVVFSWIVYPDKATYQAAHAKIMADPRMAPDPGTDMPFDGKRMIFGGFSTLFDTGEPASSRT